jgi:hypothetical protein
MSNKRIFYASQSINLQPVSTGTANPINYRNATHYVKYGDGDSWVVPLGLQSAGVSTTFNSEPVSQLGTLQIYAQTETSPEVEVTLSKILDGTAPLYSICTAKVDPSDDTILSSINADLTQVATNMVNVRIAVASDTGAAATGTAKHHTLCERMYLSSVSFTFPVDGNATEEVTLVGTNKSWGSSVTLPGDDTATPYGTGTDAIVRRQYISVTGTATSATRDEYDRIDQSDLPDNSILPVKLPRYSINGVSQPRLQNITVNASFNRENINELGFFGPYYKYTTFPLEVTSEFEVIAVSGDLVNANDFEYQDNEGNAASAFDCTTKYTNLANEEIVIKVCGITTNDSLYLDLGKKNKLTSVNYTGGDTGGGNATITYSYQTFNKLNVIPVGTYAEYVTHDGSTSTTATLQNYNS